MSFKQHAYPLRIEPVTSRYWVAICCCLHLIAYMGVIWTSLPWYACIAALVAVSVSFFCSLRRCRRRLSLTWDVEGDWHITIDGRTLAPARLLGSSVVNRYFVWLHLRRGRRLVPLILPRDTLPADDFRRLRVRLLVDGTNC